MKGFLRQTVMLAVLGMFAAVVAGCGASVQSRSAKEVANAHDVDTTIKAYKDGQFLLNGAVLSSMDLNSHFSYLQDQDDLPGTVLLEGSDDSSIKRQHLRYMATIAQNYGLNVLYDDDGKLRRIVPSEATKLEGGKQRKLINTHPVEKKNAAHSGTRRGRGRGGF